MSLFLNVHWRAKLMRSGFYLKRKRGTKAVHGRRVTCDDDNDVFCLFLQKQKLESERLHTFSVTLLMVRRSLRRLAIKSWCVHSHTFVLGPNTLLQHREGVLAPPAPLTPSITPLHISNTLATHQQHLSHLSNLSHLVPGPTLATH